MAVTGLCKARGLELRPYAMLNGANLSNNSNQSQGEDGSLVSKAIQWLFKLKSKPASSLRFQGNESMADFERLLEGLTQQFRNSAEETISPLQEGQPVIFLDVDGVCWPHRSLYKTPRLVQLESDSDLNALVTNHLPMIKERYGFFKEWALLATASWDPQMMARIANLCRAFNARIVMSSAWRQERTDEQLKNTLGLWGLGQYYLGKTRDDQSHKDCRTTQVSEWLMRHTNAKHFIIIDDDYVTNMTQRFPNHFIQCDPIKAFDEEAYERAKGTLQKQLAKKALNYR